MTDHALNINETVLLLGAGASADAGIMTSADMLKHLENKIATDADWKKFGDLYFLVKGFSEGAATAFRESNRGVFHVEALVEILQGIESMEHSLLYPFFGGWTPPLEALCRRDPEMAGELSRQIFLEVRKLLTPKKLSACSYFEQIGQVAAKSGFPLRVFTLNYDLCLEKACANYSIQRGFGEEKNGAIADDADRIWDWNNFDEDSTINSNIVLYKLHGSLDWTRNKSTGIIEAVDSHESISFGDSVMIFGGGSKLKSVDPYLFNVYEFRRWTMGQMRRLVCIGYSFSDGYVNELIKQSFNDDRTRELLVVGRKKVVGPEKIKEAEDWYRNHLDLPKKSVVKYLPEGSKGFLENATAQSLAETSSNIPF